MSKDETKEVAVAGQLPPPAPAELYSAIDAEDGDSAYVAQPARLRWGSGGIKAFIDAMTDDVIKELKGVVAISRISRVFWDSTFESSGGGTPPDCYSIDGKTGSNPAVNPHPRLLCAACPKAKFGTDSKGKGQACRELRRLIILPADGGVPYILNVPPTSMKAWDQYCTALRGKALRYYSVESKLTLETTKNKDGIEYARLKVEMTKPLEFDSVVEVIRLRDIVGPFLQAPVAFEDAGAVELDPNDVID